MKINDRDIIVEKGADRKARIWNEDVKRQL